MKVITTILITATIASSAFAQEFDPNAQPYVLAMRQHQARQDAISKLRAEERAESDRRVAALMKDLDEAKRTARQARQQVQAELYAAVPQRQRQTVVAAPSPSSSPIVGATPSSKRISPPVPTSATQYGNITYYSNGATATRHGNITYNSNGTTATQYGNISYGSNGVTGTRYGNTTHYSNGTTATQYGNTTYFSK